MWDGWIFTQHNLNILWIFWGFYAVPLHGIYTKCTFLFKDWVTDQGGVWGFCALSPAVWWFWFTSVCDWNAFLCIKEKGKKKNRHEAFCKYSGLFPFNVNTHWHDLHLVLYIIKYIMGTCEPRASHLIVQQQKYTLYRTHVWYETCWTRVSCSGSLYSSCSTKFSKQIPVTAANTPHIYPLLRRTAERR